MYIYLPIQTDKSIHLSALIFPLFFVSFFFLTTMETTMKYGTFAPDTICHGGQQMQMCSEDSVVFLVSFTVPAQ